MPALSNYLDHSLRMTSNGRLESPGGYDGADIEDEVPDWKALGSMKGATSVPKRGEKDFEPDGTRTQGTLLQESKDAMYEALEGVRGHHNRQSLQGVWIPEKKKTLVLHPRGNFFKDMGSAANIGPKVRGLWLDGMESTYLVERGSLAVFLSSQEFIDYLALDQTKQFDVLSKLVLLTLSEVYAYAFSGCNHKDIYQYQVFALLKRNGYLVQKFRRIGMDQSQAYSTLYGSPSIKRRILSTFDCVLSFFLPRRIISLAENFLQRIGFMALPIWNDLHFYTKHYFNYSSIFRSLWMTPSYSSFDSLANEINNEKYVIHFNVWKPSPSFSKKNPPIPNFHVSVVDAESEGVPNPSDIHGLFNQINYEFLNKNASAKPKVDTSLRDFNKKASEPSKKEIRLLRQQQRQSKLSPEKKKFVNYNQLRDSKLKLGASGRSVIFAVVQSGVISFINFGEGDFALKGACTEDLSALIPKDHGIIWNDIGK